MVSKETARYILLAIGLIIGWLHFKVGGRVMFVMRGDEPLLLTFIILTGPLSTLPATIVFFFKPRVGGIWLIAGGICSLILVVVYKEKYMMGKDIVQHAIKFSGPMIILGVGALLLRNWKKEEKNE